MTDLTWQKHAADALQNNSNLSADWDRLSAERLDLPFMCSDAVSAALAVFGSGQEVLLVGRHGPIVHAMLVLVPDGHLRWRTFQPSQLPLGTWVAASSLSLTTVAQSLMRGPMGVCLVLSITQIDPLQAPRQSDNARTRHSDYIDTAWLDIHGSFDDYWSARGKNLRQNMRKQRNKLAAEGTATKLRIWTDVTDMSSALTRYGALESQGWKASEGTAIEAGNDQGRFYTRLFEGAARRGEAFVTEYLFNERTVAMNLGLLRGGTLVVLKTAYDESVPKTLSPASLLREEELQQFHAGTAVRRIEYYGKVMDWHTKLTECKRGVYHLTVYRWALLKRLAERRSAGQRVQDVPAPEAARATAATTSAAD